VRSTRYAASDPLRGIYKAHILERYAEGAAPPESVCFCRFVHSKAVIRGAQPAPASRVTGQIVPLLSR
jgi:hypothetical protein